MGTPLRVTWTWVLPKLLANIEHEWHPDEAVTDRFFGDQLRSLCSGSLGGGTAEKSLQSHLKSVSLPYSGTLYAWSKLTPAPLFLAIFQLQQGEAEGKAVEQEEAAWAPVPAQSVCQSSVKGSCRFVIFTVRSQNPEFELGSQTGETEQCIMTSVFSKDISHNVLSDAKWPTPSGPCTWLTLGAPWVGMPAIQPPSVKSCHFLHSSAKITPKKSILIMLQCILSLSKYLVLKKANLLNFYSKVSFDFLPMPSFLSRSPALPSTFYSPHDTLRWH